MRFCAVLFALVTGCVVVDVREGKPDAIWSLSARNMISAQDQSVRVCCPQSGGDIWVNAIVRDDGRVVNVDVTRPPAGPASGALCVPAVALTEMFNAIDPETIDEGKEIIDGCAERKRALGGSWLWNPMPEASRRCFEQFLGSWQWQRGTTTPISLELKCPGP